MDRLLSRAIYKDSFSFSPFNQTRQNHHLSYTSQSLPRPHEFTMYFPKSSIVGLTTAASLICPVLSCVQFSMNEEQGAMPFLTLPQLIKNPIPSFPLLPY